jgi:hypothetical protein
MQPLYFKSNSPTNHFPAEFLRVINGCGISRKEIAKEIKISYNRLNDLISTKGTRLYGKEFKKIKDFYLKYKDKCKNEERTYDMEIIERIDNVLKNQKQVIKEDSMNEYKPHNIKITINTSNSTFEQNEASEVKEILKDLVENKLQEIGPLKEGAIKLRDSNGNIVGYFIVK